MGKVDSYEEILQFAIAKEVEAHHFCLALAGRVDTPRMRQVFEDLAQEEAPKPVENNEGTDEAVKAG